MLTRYMSLSRTTRTHDIALSPLESNSEVDLTSHCRETTTLLPYVNDNETQSARVCDLLSIMFSLPMNWCP